MANSLTHSIHSSDVNFFYGTVVPEGSEGCELDSLPRQDLFFLGSSKVVTFNSTTKKAVLRYC